MPSGSGGSPAGHQRGAQCQRWPTQKCTVQWAPRWPEKGRWGFGVRSGEASGHQLSGGPKSVQEEGPRIRDGEPDLQTSLQEMLGDTQGHSWCREEGVRNREPGHSSSPTEGRRHLWQLWNRAASHGWVLNPAHHLFLQTVLLELSRIPSLCLIYDSFRAHVEGRCHDKDPLALKDGLPSP